MILPILFLSFLVRIIGLNQSFWLDEAVQAWASSNFSISNLLKVYMPGDFNPPGYHLLIHFWSRLFGTSEIALRMPSVFFGLISVWLIWKIVIIVADNKTANTTALLLAISPLHIFYSQENRMYMLASFAVLLAVWRFLVLVKDQTWKNSSFFGLSLLVLGFSHFLAMFVLPIFFFFGIKKIKRNRLFFPFALLAISYLFYSPLLLKQLKTGVAWKNDFPVWGQTVGAFSLKSAALLPVKFIIGRIGLGNKIVYGAISLVLVVIYWGLVFLSLIKKSKAHFRERKSHIVFISTLLFFPPFLGFLIGFWIPVFSYFRFLFVLPFFYLLISVSLANNQKLIKPFLPVLLLVNLVCSGIYLLNPAFHRENWKEMVEWVQTENKNNSPVIILGQIMKPFEYYDQGATELVIVDNPSSANLNLLDTDQVFLISYSLPIFDPEDKIRTELKNLGYQIKQGESFRKVGIERYQLNN